MWIRKQLQNPKKNSQKGLFTKEFTKEPKRGKPNIFWCLEKKKENTNPKKHKPQPRKKSSTIAINVAISPARSCERIAISPARSHEGDLAGAISRRRSPSIAISQRRDCDRRRDLVKRRSRSSDWSSQDRRPHY